MIPRAMDSLDLVEAVILTEEVFGTEIPGSDAESIGSPKDLVNWLDPCWIG
jgi:acyl carrier protein